jgi:intracellular sulfur oxidation DsrE/DsrF family protein
MLAASVKRIVTCAITGGMIAGFGLLGVAHANPSMMKSFDFDKPSFIHPHPFVKTHLVIQVSEADPARWNLALNSAQNVMDYLGAERVQIVIVAYGPGLHVLLADTPDAARIASMDREGIEFDACHNTMEAMKRATGHMPQLIPEAVIVPAGVVRIMQLEAHGFDYIKP